MNEKITTKYLDNTLYFDGALTFDTIAVYWRTWKKSKQQPIPQVIDFEGITGADSSALALMLTFFRLAHHNQADIIFDHVPPHLLSLVKLSSLAHLLPIRETLKS